MKDVLTQFANLFNEGGGMDTVIWFFVLMITSMLLMVSRSRYLKLLLGASALCFLISFSKLDLQWQTLLFAVLAALNGFTAAKAEKTSEKPAGTADGGEADKADVKPAEKSFIKTAETITEAAVKTATEQADAPEAAQTAASAEPETDQTGREVE